MQGQLASTGDLSCRRQQRQQVADTLSQPATPKAYAGCIRGRIEDDHLPGERADEEANKIDGGYGGEALPAGSESRIANLAPPEMEDKAGGERKSGQGAKDHAELHRNVLDRPIRVPVNFGSLAKEAAAGLTENRRPCRYDLLEFQ